MCGIAGFLSPERFGDSAETHLRAMGRTIRHRGPDSHGLHIAEGVALCHQRLSIIDLSATGHQPMHSADGRYVLVFNGEIYNFPALRLDLEQRGVRFRGSSDSEVLLSLYEIEGEACLERLNGMFAFAVWDRETRSLFLARDRLGKKPLYYSGDYQRFAFASELKALSVLPGFEPRIRADALADYFTYQYVPDPKSIFEGVLKLAPGHCLTVSADGLVDRAWWNPSFAEGRHRDADDAGEELLSLLEDSVRIRMLSDVPLGAFLSGGVDSSGIVALMAGVSEQPVTTCSIGFDSREHDETVYAREVAEQFGTHHHEMVVRDNVADHLLPIATYFDEPFSDSSFVPTFFVSKLARQRVTVALAGDGGDENFAGYRKYQADRFENQLRSWIPTILRRSLFPQTARLLAGSSWPNGRRAASLLDSLALSPAAGFARSNRFFDHRLWQEILSDEFRRQLGDYDPVHVTTERYNEADTDDHLSRILYTDIKTYLPGDILVKVDRMSMANSLETRSPLLDYRVVEFAAALPASLKLHQGESKYLLKHCLSSLLTDDTLYRRKQGFSVPLAEWLRSEIRELAASHLLDPQAGLTDWFDRTVIERLWNDHLQGRGNHAAELWSLLMFELWWQHYVKR